MSKAKQKTWREHDVYARLAAVFPPPAYMLLPQVRNGTGYARKRDRTADAIAVSVWPSRGLYLAGVEIKVRRTDWRRELANPSKAADIQQYCRYWYVAAPEGVVDLGEVPETWGQISCAARATRVSKAAPKLDAKPVDLLFVCSILRKVAEVTVPADQVDRSITTKADELASAKIEMIQLRLDRAVETLMEFEKASGVKLSADEPWLAGRIGAAVRTVLDRKVDAFDEQLRELRRRAERIAARIGEELERVDATTSH